MEEQITTPLVEEEAEPRDWLSRCLAVVIAFCFITGGWFAFDALTHKDVKASAQASPQPRFVTKNIKDIQKNDFVLSRNPETGKQERKRVVETYRRTSYHLRHLTFQDNQGNKQSFQTTDEHPFWSITANEFVNAGDLKTGEKVTSPTGELLALATTFRVEHPKGIAVFNFQVEDYHTYFVASRGSRAPPVLVHNADHAYRVMSPTEYADAQNGRWIDGDLVSNDPGESGSKWLWSDEQAAREWQNFLHKNGETDNIITKVFLDGDTINYPQFPHPPQGTAIHIPIEVLKNAVELP